MRKLVRLWKRPTFGGQKYTFYLVYYDKHGRRKQKALGHADQRRAEKQRAQLARELRMDTIEANSMRLTEFLEDSLARTRGQIRENTVLMYESSMREFIAEVGDVDCRSIRHEHGERFMQRCLDDGNRSATVDKKIGALKRLFQGAVERGQLEENPFRCLRKPKNVQHAIHIYSDAECTRLVKIAQQLQIFRWDILTISSRLVARKPV